jgi:hypothetical protein
MELAEAQAVEGREILQAVGGPVRALEKIMDKAAAKQKTMRARTAPAETRTRVTKALLEVMEHPNITKALEYLKGLEPSAVNRLWKVYEVRLEEALAGGDLAEAKTALGLEAIKTLQVARKLYRAGRRPSVHQDSVGGHVDQGEKSYPQTWEDVLRTTSGPGETTPPGENGPSPDAEMEDQGGGEGGDDSGGETEGVPGENPVHPGEEGDGPTAPGLAAG